MSYAHGQLIFLESWSRSTDWGLPKRLGGLPRGAAVPALQQGMSCGRPLLLFRLAPPVRVANLELRQFSLRLQGHASGAPVLPDPAGIGYRTRSHRGMAEPAEECRNELGGGAGLLADSWGGGLPRPSAREPYGRAAAAAPRPRTRRQAVPAVPSPL